MNACIMPSFIILIAAMFSFGCGPRTEASVWPAWCTADPPIWYRIPITAGRPDTTLSAGTGGFALRPIDGTTGLPVNGAHVLIAADSARLRGSRIGNVAVDGVAVVRDLTPGEYWVQVAYIGMQGFRTQAVVVPGRVDTMTVTIYPTRVCIAH